MHDVTKSRKVRISGQVRFSGATANSGQNRPTKLKPDDQKHSLKKSVQNQRLKERTTSPRKPSILGEENKISPIWCTSSSSGKLAERSLELSRTLFLSLSLRVHEYSGPSARSKPHIFTLSESKLRIPKCSRPKARSFCIFLYQNLSVLVRVCNSSLLSSGSRRSRKEEDSNSMTLSDSSDLGIIMFH